MKLYNGWIERLAIYTITLLLLAALVMAAQAYARLSRSRLDQTRADSMSENGAEKKHGLKVKVCRVFPQKLVDILQLPGTVEPYENIDLASKLGGQIEWIGPVEGDRVRKGEELLRLDVDLIRAQAARARAAYELARVQHTRNGDLLKDGVVSAGAYDNSAATLKSALATLAETSVTLKNGVLRSPIDGVLDRRYVDRGEHIEVGQKVMRIVDIDRVKIMYDIPERSVTYLRSGQQVALVANNGATRHYSGTIEYVAMAADPRAHTYPLKIVLDNPDGHLRGGMFVDALLARRTVEQGIAVPVFATVERENGKSVFVVEDGEAHERPVETGMYQGGLVEILSGLELGELLVLVGQRNLADGRKIVIDDDLTTRAKIFVASGQDLSEFTLD